MPTHRPENPVDDYAAQVVAGAVPAGKYHRLACERHLRERGREGTPGFTYRFEWAQADRFLRFARLMKHYKGRQFAGKPFEPTPCQVFTLGSIFGWRHIETGLRRFTTAYKEVPRKNGKTFEEAVVAVYAVFFEGETGAEGYCIATKEKQAKIAFEAAKKLVKSSGLSGRIKINASNLHRLTTECKLEPLGSDSDTTDGLNPHFVGVDEFHAFKHRALLDVMESATGARLNPLFFQITTAGDDPVSPCGDQHDYACKILDGVLEDDPSTLSFFAFIAHADIEDDWLAESTWAKANPHYGISVNPDDMRKLAAKAKQMPSAAAEFKQKRLNLWVNASEPWLSMDGWRKGQTAFDQEWVGAELEGEPCWAGVDLASYIDLCALVLAFPPRPGRSKWKLLRWVWSPADTLVERARRDRAPYTVWAQQGVLITVPGTRIDHGVVKDVLSEQRKRFDIECIGFDPWHANKLIGDLRTDGWAEEQLVEVPQTYAGMSQACLVYEADVLSGDVDAGGCPLMAWSASNVVVQRDGKDNIYPVKKRSRGRIDPQMAALIARARYERRSQPEPAKPSIYETRGLLVLGE